MQEARAPDEFPRDPELQVPSRVRRAKQAAAVLRQRQDHEERARLKLLRRQPQVPGRRGRGRRRRQLPRCAARQSGSRGSHRVKSE